MGRNKRKRIVGPWYVREPRLLEELKASLKEDYPNLHVFFIGDDAFVRGSLPIRCEGKEVDRYMIELALPENYPFGPISVRETNNRIRKKADDWHVNPNGTLCLGVVEQIWPSKKNPVVIQEFLAGPVTTFLLRNSVVEQGGTWEPGEWSHGVDGIIEFYQEKSGLESQDQIVALMKILIHQDPKGHWLCPCGSEEIIRNCHASTIWKLREELPREAVIYSLRFLMRID